MARMTRTNREEFTPFRDMCMWKEWSWSFEQYINSVDPKFGDNIQNMRSKLEQPVDPVDFSDGER